MHKIEKNKKDFGVFMGDYYNYGIVNSIKGISKAGFKYVELCSYTGLLPDPIDITDDDIENLTRTLSDNKITAFSWYYYKGGKDIFIKEKVLSQFKRAFEIANFLKISHITTDADEVKDTADEKEFYKYINEIGDMASEYSIKLSIDIHGYWFCNGKEASRIIKIINNPNIGINYCTGNAIYYGNANPEEDIKYAIPNLFKVHIKDSSGIYHDYNFPALGEGKVDFSIILNELKDFYGPHIAEIELRNQGEPLSEINEAFKKSYDFLNKMKLV